MGCSRSRLEGAQEADSSRQRNGREGPEGDQEAIAGTQDGNAAPGGGPEDKALRKPIPFKEPTMKASINLRKDSLKLTADTAKPGSYSLQFTTDCSKACIASVFIMAYEKEPAKSQQQLPARLKSKITQRKPSITYKIEGGLNQVHVSPPGQGLQYDSIEAVDLSAEAANLKQIFPLIIRIQTVPNPGDSPEMAAANIEALTTFAALQPEDDGFNVQVLKQIIWMQGQPLVLNEVFDVVSGSSHNGNSQLAARDCTICMDKSCDTLALPCRHLFACSTCAASFAEESNKCPICRQTVQSLLRLQLAEAATPKFIDIAEVQKEDVGSFGEPSGHAVPNVQA